MTLLEGTEHSVMVAIYSVANDHPTSSDVFFVDTCCWVLSIYVLGLPIALSNFQDHARGSAYGSYLQRVRLVGGRIVLFSYQLAEVASAIEDIRYRIHLHQSGQTQADLRVKEFRAIPELRNLVVSEIQSTWSMIKLAAVTPQIHLPELSDQSLLTTLKTTELDGYDAIAREAMNSQGITRVITDDSDYLTAGNIDVFTAAPKFLNSGQPIHAR